MNEQRKSHYKAEVGRSQKLPTGKSPQERWICTGTFPMALPPAWASELAVLQGIWAAVDNKGL